MTCSIVVGSEQDAHAQHMISALKDAGREALLFDVSAFPADAEVSYCPHDDFGVLSLTEQKVSFNEIHSVFWSQITPVGLNNELPATQQMIALNDAQAVIKSLLLDHHIKWVNPWHAFQYHKVKPRQLRHAMDLGARIPATLTSNDASEILQFCSLHKECIFKPVYGGALTERVSPAHLQPAHLDRALSLSPVTIQEYVAGTNIRTYVLGNKVFSAELHSQQIDFRSDDNCHITLIDTPASLAQLSTTICQAFGMLWTAIDWRRNPQGQYYFLEANPSPMFIHFERQTGVPITRYLVEMLTAS